MIFYFVRLISLRSYKYLVLTAASLCIGAFLFGALSSLSQSVSTFFITQGATLIGGDISLTSGQPIDSSAEIFTRARSTGAMISSEYEFQTVFRNEAGTVSQTARIRAVDAAFPLYGSVVLEGGALFTLTERTIYADDAFIRALGAVVGDTVFVGDSPMAIAGRITSVPDAIATGVSFAPLVVMSSSDIVALGIDLKQSRVTYKVRIKQGADASASSRLSEELQTYSREKKMRFDDARDGPNTYIRGLSSVQDFAGIVLAIALFLVAVNIGANLAYIRARFLQTIALLKVYGATTRQIRAIYLSILGSIGFVSGVVGSYLGAYAATWVLPLFAAYTPETIEPVSSLPIAVLGGVSALVLCVISALPFLRSLRLVSPKQLLQRTTDSAEESWWSAYVWYVPIPVFLLVVLFGISQNVYLALYSVLVLVVLFVLFAGITYVCCRYAYARRARRSFNAQVLIASLWWRRAETIVTSAAIATAFTGICIVAAIERNIVVNVHGALDTSAPALYLVDITASQLPVVKKIAGLAFQPFAIVRGRLLAINDRDMTTSTDGGITREFNMTYRSERLPGESVSSGVWHGESGATNAVSFDTSFAEQVGGVTVGDTVTVFIQGIEVMAQVTSMHTANRTSGAPFFYMVFSPDVLASFPVTYFGTYSGKPADVQAVRLQLGTQFPNIIPIETQTIVATVSTLVATLVAVVQGISVPSILLGLLLVLIMTGQSLYERRGDVLILRAFGFTQTSATRLFITEVVLLVLASAATAYGVAHVVAYVLNVYLFSFTSFTSALTPLYIVAAIVGAAAVYAYSISRSLVTDSLKKLLAEK
jgi:putative ABC transport system permease protein